MQEERRLAQLVQAASGAQKAQLVLKGAQIVNVFTERLEQADVAIQDGVIAGIGTYEGEQEIDLSGKVICPGFLDGHIHLESAMVSPGAFAQAVVPHGTTAVVTDPHEISNVAGTQGIDYILHETEELELDVFVLLPSCVPSTPLDESGAELTAADLKPYYEHPRVLGLAEMMNAYGTVHADPGVLKKISDARRAGKLVDGHAPGLSGGGLNAYAAAGVGADHECSTAAEALEKLARGQWIMIREGTAAKNLEALMPLCQPPYEKRCMFVTDDRHPGELVSEGHLDAILKKAMALGADPIRAVKLVTLHPAQYFGLTGYGAVAPGYQADLVVLSDLTAMEVCQVYKRGLLVAEHGKMTGAPKENACRPEDYPRVFQSFHLDEVTREQLAFVPKGDRQRVLCLTPGELLTRAWERNWSETPGCAPGVSLSEDVVKMAVLERHRHTGHVGIGFLGGYGLKAGAVATSVAHDSHNLIVAGVTDEDMALAANQVRQMGGGLAVVRDGVVLGSLALPIGGLMSLEPAAETGKKLKELKGVTRELGIPAGIDPFMTLAFASLPVIPKLRLNTLGLIDTEKQELVEVTYQQEY